MIADLSIDCRTQTIQNMVRWPSSCLMQTKTRHTALPALATSGSGKCFVSPGNAHWYVSFEACNSLLTMTSLVALKGICISQDPCVQLLRAMLIAS